MLKWKTHLTSVERSTEDINSSINFSLEKGLANCGPWAKSHQLTLFAQRVK